jgi:hypothetical protein
MIHTPLTQILNVEVALSDYQQSLLAPGSLLRRELFNWSLVITPACLPHEFFRIAPAEMPHKKKFAVIAGKGDPRSHSELNWFRFEEFVLNKFSERLKVSEKTPFWHKQFGICPLRLHASIFENAVFLACKSAMENNYIAILEDFVPYVHNAIKANHLQDWYSVEKDRMFSDTYSLVRRDVGITLLFTRNRQINYQSLQKVTR